MSSFPTSNANGTRVTEGQKTMWSLFCAIESPGTKIVFSPGQSSALTNKYINTPETSRARETYGPMEEKTIW